MTTIVFLHVPKTAGQTIHHQLAHAVGQAHLSPIRTQSQAPDQSHLPPGYRLYSGHIDWTDLDSLPADRFVFSVLRDPRERLASFYFFLLKEARARAETGPEQALSLPQKQILALSPDDYFRQDFVRDHYDNFYCGYFATRRVGGRRRLDGLPPAQVLARARDGLAALDGLYWTDRLDLLERDLRRRCGLRIRVVGRMQNTGSVPLEQPRWPLLLSRCETDATRCRLEDFVALDLALLEDVPRPPAPGPLARLAQLFDRKSR